ncbi:MAG: DUF4349 domain-containing protein [Actinomycetota bacterium]
MSEAKFESVTRELRATAPPAPEGLRERVRDLRAPDVRRVVRLRPALVAAVAIAIAVGLGAATVGGLFGSPEGSDQTAVRGRAIELPGVLDAPELRRVTPRAPNTQGDSTFRAAKAPRFSRPPFQLQASAGFAPLLVPGTRLQQYAVAMNLRVRDLSRSTQAAVRQTRRLGGYVAAANYSTGSTTGDSSLDLRVPVQNVQHAIAKFTDLGTILSQRISVGDLQAPLDRTDARIAAQRKIIDELAAKDVRTPAEQQRLDGARRALRRLTQTHTNLVREGTYARISLQLTTRKPVAKHVAPSRFDRFWDNSGDILGKEAIAVLYALVVAGPFAILALLALLAERTRRRRADHRLLEGTG